MREKESTGVYRRYAFALATVPAAVFLRLLLDPPLGSSFPFATLFFAVLLAAGYGGFGPAMLATVLGAIGSVLFLLPARDGSFDANRENLGGLVLYLAVSTGIALIGYSLRRARRRAESGSQAAASQAESLRVTLLSIGDAVIVTDVDGRITSMNPVAAELTRWPFEEARGKPLSEVFHIIDEVSRATAPDPVTRALGEGRSVGLANHTVLIARDGCEHSIDDSAAPIRGEDGAVQGAVLVFRDVGDRRHAELALRRSEQDLHDFFENANVGLHWVGPDGIIQRANQAELDLLGYSREEYVGHPIAEFHADADVISDILARLAAGETLRGYPARMRCKDGSIRHVLINSSVLREEGRFIRTRCFTLDVTDRRQAEEAQALLAAVVASSEDAIVTKTLDGVITSWNGAAERLFEYSAAEAVGRSISIILAPDQVDEERTIIERLRRGERIEHLETTRVTKTGRRLDIALTISPLRDGSGRVVGASKLARDITARRAAEARLRILAAVVEQSGDFIGISTPDLTPIFVNEAGRRMVGFDSLDDAVRHPVMEYFWPEDRPQIEREAVPALLEVGHWRGETRFRHFKENRPIHTVWDVTAIRDEAGATIAYATVSPNLDAFKATQRALAASQAELRAEATALHRLQELNTRLLATTDLRSALEQILAATIELLEADKGNLQLLNESEGVLEIATQQGFDEAFLQHFGRVDAADSSACGRCLRSGQRVIIPDVDADPDFAPHAAIARAAGYRSVQTTPLIGRNGRALGALSTHSARVGQPAEWRLRLLDLHAPLAAESIERMRDEDSLRQSEERFHTLADNIAQFAWMADANGEALWINKRWFEYTGLTAEEFQGQEWRRRIHHPDFIDGVLARAAQSFARGEPWEETFPLRGVDGQFRWFLTRSTPIRGADGKVQRWFGTNTDVTELREAEEALRQADRRKDEFLATLAHELRNPLAPVRNALEIMKRADGDAGLLEQARAMMDRQMAHLERLVDDLLDVSRITRDKLELRRQPVTLGAIVKQAVETCRPLAEASRQNVEVSLPAEPIHLDADPVRLGQVFSNLLSNACKYSDPGGHIRVTAEPRGDIVSISVRDQGVGIPADMLGSVFEMFAQVPASSERAQGGLGIGLTLVRRLVEMHGGTVRAHSEGVGRGSEFILELPTLREPLAAAAPAPATSASLGGGRRILVVDDNRDAAESLALLLRLAGHETQVAHDGLEAVDLAAAFCPDVVLLDIGLPKLSGYDVARAIREQPAGADVMLIALTGWGQDGDRRRSREVGFDHHLVKPVDPTALAALLSD